MIEPGYPFTESILRTGQFGVFGGAYTPEILHTTFESLKKTFLDAFYDPCFWAEYEAVMQSYSCRPTPITYLENLSKKLNIQLYCKREDLNQTGAHKANNVMGQGLLVKRMGKKRVIAETGAGQHGVATATMAARFGLDCTVYMGAIDVERQKPNVFWMEQLGAKVIPVTDGTASLKDAINAALRDWSDSMDNTHYVLGTACGAHPFPLMVAYFQSIIGKEALVQMPKLCGRLPDTIYACVGGGSNALGIFLPFLAYPEVKLVGVEAGGKGIATTEHAARFFGGSVGVVQGYKTYFLQDKDGQMMDTYSIAAGLDYIGVSPILSHLHEENRVRFTYALDNDVWEAAQLLIKTEGIIPALESSHGLAAIIKEAPQLKDQIVLWNLSGRGDKDIINFAKLSGNQAIFSI